MVKQLLQEPPTQQRQQQVQLLEHQGLLDLMATTLIPQLNTAVNNTAGIICKLQQQLDQMANLLCQLMAPQQASQNQDSVLASMQVASVDK